MMPMMMIRGNVVVPIIMSATITIIVFVIPILKGVIVVIPVQIDTIVAIVTSVTFAFLRPVQFRPGISCFEDGTFLCRQLRVAIAVATDPVNWLSVVVGCNVTFARAK